MNTPRKPYGWEPEHYRCVNAEPGHFNHECGRYATWIGTTELGWRACYCDGCKDYGHEAKRCVSWEPIANPIVEN